MATSTLASLSQTLVDSLETARHSLLQPDQLKPPTNGISLLDTKNELLLNYVENLVFLIVLKLRESYGTSDDSEHGHDDSSSAELREKVVKTLVDLRIYLERGVKSLEARLRYQIDKVVRAAEAADHKSATIGAPRKGAKAAKKRGAGSANGDVSGSSDAESEDVDPLLYRPNPSAFNRSDDVSSKDATTKDSSSGIYRPPRIAATVMPEARRTKAEKAARPQKSATLEEFVASELSTAPVAEPSIGTTIRQGGRRSTNERERRETRARQEYEETHFVRLPNESKAAKRKTSGRARDAGWGGEEWRDIGRGAERLTGALSRRNGSGDGNRVRRAIEEDRRRDREGGGAHGHRGARIGEAFERMKKGTDSGAKRRKVR